MKSQLSYLNSAPQRLISHHKSHSFPGQDVLGRYLSDRTMSRAWTELTRRTKDNLWLILWQEIAYILWTINKSPASRTKIKREYLRVADRAEKLANLIVDGPLDLMAYELFPSAVMEILGIADWSAMDRLQRSSKANCLLKCWPTAPELLTELSVRARQQANDAIKKDRVVERKTRDYKKLYFCRSLCSYFVDTYKTPLYGTVSKFASVAFKCKVTKEFVIKAVKKGSISA